MSKENISLIMTLFILILGFVSSFEVSSWDFPEEQPTIIEGANYYNKSEVDTLISEIPSPDLSNYLNTTNNQIPVYTTATAASTMIKEISITGSVETGQIIGVKLTNGNTVGANMRVRVNTGLPDFKVGIVYLGGTASYNGALELGANSVLYVQWEGTRWNVVGGTTAPLETNSFVPLHSEYKAGATIYNYVFAMVGADSLVYPLILTSSTASNKPVSSQGFDISQGVMFNPGKGTQSTNANLKDKMYFSGLNPSEAYALNSVSGFTLNKNIYLKGTINQTDGLFYLERSGYNTWYSQTLPTTEDGYVYVLFATHGGGSLKVSIHNPAYWFKNGAVRPYGIYANTDRKDNFKEYFGNDNDASIYYDGTNLLFNTTESGNGLAYFSNNISATGYITRTSVFDKSKGTALNYIKDASEYLYAKGDINHKAFYGYVEHKVTDFSKPVIDYLPKQVCSTDENEKEKCVIEYETKITYPYTKIEDGVDMGKEIDVLRQAVYELKMELEKVKSETCTIKLFSWCIK